MFGQIAAATPRIRVGSGGVTLPNHAPLMVAERFKVLQALFPGLRPWPRTGDRSGHFVCVARAAGPTGRRRIPRTLLGIVAAGGKRFSGGSSVPQRARDAGRCRAAAHLAVGVERLQRGARGRVRNGFRFCASFRRLRCGERHAQLSQKFQAIGGAGAALRHSRHRGDSGRYGCASGTHRRECRTALRAARPRRISSTGIAGSRRGLSLHAKRSRKAGAPSRPARGRKR